MIDILITGGEGFIGSHMIKFFENKKNYMIHYTTKNCDLRKYKNALDMTRNIDYVFHFAANMGGIGYFSNQNYYPVIDNFLMDLNMLRACEENKVKRLFYPSSACIYDISLMNAGANLAEYMLEFPTIPDQMYGWEKLTMLKLMGYSPVDCRVGILHTIYGPGQAYEGPKAKFPPQMAYKIVRSFLDGVRKPVEVWGDGTQTRTFLYIDDAIRKIFEVMTKKYHGPVNIGSSKEVSVNQIVSLCCRILKIKPKIIHNTKAPVGPKRRRCSNTKFNKYYKTRERVTLNEGFKKLIEELCRNLKHQ